MDDQTTGNGTTLKVSISAKDSEKTKVGNWSCTQKPPEPAWDETGDRSKTFLIRNRVYEVRKCLSDNSGEAQVYLVESEGQSYVLKVYYPNFTADKQLMKVIANMNFEMIVRLYDYGKVCVNGKNRDFELMEFLGGGTPLPIVTTVVSYIKTSNQATCSLGTKRRHRSCLLTLAYLLCSNMARPCSARPRQGRLPTPRRRCITM